MKTKLNQLLFSKQVQNILIGIRFQRIGSLGGLVLYPTLSLLGVPQMIYYTPICVFTHYIAQSELQRKLNLLMRHDKTCFGIGAGMM